MSSIILSSITLEDLAEKIAIKISALEIKTTIVSNEATLLTVNEVCALLRISRPTLAAWTSQKKLQDHRIGSRIYYKKNEIDSALTKINRLTDYKV